jgi:hypothetical protein
MPVAVMMVVVMMAMMPAMPPIMVVMMVSPMYFRRRQLCVFLNGRGSAGIAERERIGRRSERKQRAKGGKPENFRELHEISPSWSRLRRTARRDVACNLMLAD